MPRKDYFLMIMKRGDDQENHYPLYRIYGNPHPITVSEPANEVQILDKKLFGITQGYAIRQTRWNHGDISLDEAYELAACLNTAVQMVMQLESTGIVDLENLYFGYGIKVLGDPTHTHNDDPSVN